MIAGVGMGGSDLDALIFKDVVDILGLRRDEYFGALDMICLPERDFLVESGKYDIVILNYIFRSEPSDREKLYAEILDMGESVICSPFHTEENWERRLIDSGAREILMFHSDMKSEIDNTYLGELEGYNVEVIELKPGCWVTRYHKD